MSDARKQIFNLAALPDWAVLTDQQTSGVLGLSLDTLRRLDRGRNEPPRVELSPRRHGRPVGELRKWIQQRVGASLHGPQIHADADRIVAGAKYTSYQPPGRAERHPSSQGAWARTRKLVAKGQSRTKP
jgi:hypothetical protein